MKKIKIDMQITELYVPEEANWIAMDQDGKWMWYKLKPFLNSYSWVWLPCKEEESEFDEGVRFLCKCNSLSKDEWKDSLIEL